MSAAANKKQKTDNVVWPTINGVVKICDGVEKPILQTLATVCAKLYDEALFAAWTPADGKPIDDQLAQAYELSKPGGQYNPGGTYKPLEGGKYEYLNGKGDVVKGFDVFNHSTIQPVDGTPYGSASLASYGKVVGGFTDFHGMDQATIPPFAALVVQPNADETEVRASYPKPPPTLPRLPAESCPPSAGPYPHPRLARICHGDGLDQRRRVLSDSL